MTSDFSSAQQILFSDTVKATGDILTKTWFLNSSHSQSCYKQRNKSTNSVINAQFQIQKQSAMETHKKDNHENSGWEATIWVCVCVGVHIPIEGAL